MDQKWKTEHWEESRQRFLLNSGFLHPFWPKKVQGTERALHSRAGAQSTPHFAGGTEINPIYSVSFNSSVPLTVLSVLPLTLFHVEQNSFYV